MVFLDKARALFNLWLISPHYWGSVLSTLPDVPYKVFHSGWWKSELFLALCQLLQWFCFFQWLFPWLWVVSSHECIDLYSAEDLRVTLCKTLQLSLFTSLYLKLTCLVVYPANFSCLGFLEFSTLFPQPGRPLSSISVCPACIVAWKLQIVGFTICFLSLRDYCPMLPIVQCLKTVVSCILSDFVVVQDKLVSAPSSWLEELYVVFNDS